MKYAAFDIGQVLCDFDIDIFVNEFNKRFNETYPFPPNGLLFLEYIQPLQDCGLTNLERELIHYIMFIEGSIQDSYYANKTLKELKQKWNDTISLNKEMVQFINKQMERGVKIALLSNMGVDHKKHIKSTMPELFENKILHLSCDVGARKPSKLYFQSFLLEHPEFIGATFVDDNKDNINIAGQFGFKPYQFDLNNFNKYDKFSKEKELRELDFVINF